MTLAEEALAFWRTALVLRQINPKSPRANTLLRTLCKHSRRPKIKARALQLMETMTDD